MKLKKQMKQKMKTNQTPHPKHQRRRLKKHPLQKKKTPHRQTQRNSRVQKNIGQIKAEIIYLTFFDISRKISYNEIRRMQDLSRLTTAFYIASTLTFDRRTSTLDVIKISPRGYCYGVVDAMVIAKNASLDKTLPRPIYILGMIVHNKHVTDAFEEDGIYTLDGTNRLEILKQVEKGTVIFTAHGVSPEVRKAAEEKGLVTIDATCPDVTKTHDLIRKVKAEGYHVIYIGKKATLSLKEPSASLLKSFISLKQRKT